MASRFPIAADRIAATLAALLEAQGQHEIAEVVSAANPSIEETGYDNWNGGIYLHTLHLELPVAQYAKIETDVADVEREIASKLERATRTTGSYILREVVITPAFEATAPSPRRAPSNDRADRVWDPGMLRLFLSHVSEHKVAVSDLKRELRQFGVSGFVAHEDIAPSLEWQEEIEVALQSMDAMAALLTPRFHDSSWTDQEVGVAVGRGVLVIPVRLPAVPYGFMAKIQALRGDLSRPAPLASALVDVLLTRPRTAAGMREALVVALERSSSWASSKTSSTKIETAGRFTAAQLARIEAAITANDEVNGSFGVPERLRRVLARGATEE